MRGTESQFLQTHNVAAITLLDLLPPSITVPVIDAADEPFVDSLLSQLPPEILNSVTNNQSQDMIDVESAVSSAKVEVLSFDHKRLILARVLRSPQFSQSLISLTGALRDGGLPAISDALGIPVANGGYTHPGGLAMGGNDATGAFIGGIKNLVGCDRATNRKPKLR